MDTGRPDEFEAESLWDYEVFARAELAGGRATATANLFYYDMRNAQRAKSILILTPSGRQVGFSNLFNVPRARSYGAEGQLTWRANERLSGTLAMGLLGSKVVETDEDGANLEDREFDRTPRFSAAAAIAWKPMARLQISAQARHHSSYFTDPENTPEVRVGSATTVDARAEYRLDRVTIFAQVRNVFNALNMLDLGNPHPVTGEPQLGEAEDPRMIAIGLETRF